MFGRTAEPVQDLSDVIGIGDVDELRTVLQAPGMSRAVADVQIADDQKSLYVTNESSQSYRLAISPKVLADAHMSVPKPKPSIHFQVHFTPDEAGLALLKYWDLELDKYHVPVRCYAPYTRDGKLLFRSSLSVEKHFEYPVAEFVNGTLAHRYFYPYKLSRSLLSMVRETKSTVVSFHELGACRVRIKSSCAEYDFWMLGKEEQYSR
jgi:hypothetical protein